MLDIIMGYDELKELGLTLGSGAIIVFDEETSVYDILNNILHFFKHESCGKCVPCRIGTTQLLLLMGKIKNADNRDILYSNLVEQSELMAKTSLCPLGQSPVLPVISAY